jgi:hypothetical protein
MSGFLYAGFTGGLYVAMPGELLCHVEEDEVVGREVGLRRGKIVGASVLHEICPGLSEKLPGINGVRGRGFWKICPGLIRV